MASCSSSGSDYLKREQRLLKKKQITTVAKDLEELDIKGVVERVKGEVEAGYHLRHFPERKEFWDACAKEDAFDEFVAALLTEYVSLVRGCSKGREKFGNFQVKWMDFVRRLLHDRPESESHPAITQWAVLVEKTGQRSSISTIKAIIMSVVRSFFNYCQQRVVAFKEGASLLLEEEQETPDAMEEAGLDVDEAALYRLGGYALFSTLKAYESYAETTGENVCTVLRSLRLPFDQKVDLPSNIRHLDKGRMTFMKKELLGYLAKVHSRMRERTSTEYARIHGANIMKVVEDELLKDEDLQQAFIFSCGEIGIIAPNLVGVLPLIHQQLLKKMIHTHGNEVLENRRMLSSFDHGVVLDVPLMLRDSLKVIAAKTDQ